MSATADGRISFGQQPPNTSESTVVQSQNMQGMEDQMREMHKGMEAINRENRARIRELTRNNEALKTQLHKANVALTLQLHREWEDHIRQRFDHLSGLVEELKKVQNEKKSTLYSPFCATIARGKIPSNFKLPTLSTYDNLSDPVVHVKTYLQAMTQWVNDDIVLCRFFASSLVGPALNWFYRLPPTRIQNFAELTDEFVHQFAYLRVTTTKLFTILALKQESGESVETFVARFTTKMSTVEKLMPENLIVAAFINALGVFKLKRELILQMPRTWSELVKKVEQVCGLDEQEESPYYGVTFARENKMKRKFTPSSWPKKRPRYFAPLGASPGVKQLHNDATVISVNIGGWDVERVLVDPDISMQVLFKEAFDKMVPHSEMLKRPIGVVWFNGSKVKALGEITLPVRAAKVVLKIPFTLPVSAAKVVLKIPFTVLNFESPYNAVLGRGWINALK